MSPSHLSHQQAFHMAVGQNQLYHSGVGAPPILVYLGGIGMFTGGTGLTYGHLSFSGEPPSQKRRGASEKTRQGQAELAQLEMESHGLDHLNSREHTAPPPGALGRPWERVFSLFFSACFSSFFSEGVFLSFVVGLLCFLCFGLQGRGLPLVLGIADPLQCCPRFFSRA